ALAGKGRDRHQLDRCHAELAQSAQARDGAVERALPAERPDVDLVDREPVERDTLPAVVAPVERIRVDDARRSANALRLPPRARVWPRLAVDDEHVVLAGEPSDPVLAVALQVDLRVRADEDRTGIRRPDACLRHAVTARHCTQSKHLGYSGTSQT